MTQPTEHTDTGPAGGFLAEVKDAVTLRAAVLVLGVLALQLAFVTSYIGAFHHPKPSEIPIAVAAPAQPLAARTAERLGALPGEPLDPRAVADEATALAQIRNREVDGALIIDSQALEQIVGAAEKSQGRGVVVVDVAPADRGDSRGLSSFYLVVGWCVGGYLCAAVLAVSAGARPANVHRAVIRLGTLLLYSIAAGLLGTLIAGPVLGALPGPITALWGLGTLVVFAVGALTLALQGLAGVVGIGLAILLVVVLGNPSAGGAYPYPLLPPFWRAIGPALPPGAGTFAARSIAYFRGNGAAGPMLVLSAWAVAGSAVTLVCAAVRRGRPGAAVGSGLPDEATPTEWPAA
ncbi:membrane protein [Streptomyces katrae]|uniref:Membrane protein n=1 Tax=Streptomyces katrae TaxID=68223 RepID=A0A0F4IW40_9ACTN|nr:membrane protein [Streptomyces katrae]KJY25673.1 membrane protein [Streptomyces katrae]